MTIFANPTAIFSNVTCHSDLDVELPDGVASYSEATQNPTFTELNSVIQLNH